MADTSKDGLLLGETVCHVTAMSQLTGALNKYLLAYVIGWVDISKISSISLYWYRYRIDTLDIGFFDILISYQ